MILAGLFISSLVSVIFLVGRPANKLGFVKVTGVGPVIVWVIVGVLLITIGLNGFEFNGDPWYKTESVVFILGFLLKSFVNRSCTT